jgi:hypothetical protein
MVNETFLESVREETPGFNDEIERAWKLALAHLSVAMTNEDHTSVSPPSSMKQSYEELKSILYKSGEGKSKE